jgi:hypothetical protein
MLSECGDEVFSVYVYSITQQSRKVKDVRITVSDRKFFLNKGYLSVIRIFSFPFVLFYAPNPPNAPPQRPHPRGSKTCLLMQTLAFVSLRSPKGKTPLLDAFHSKPKAYWREREVGM